MAGRPSKYTPELAAEICSRLMRPESLRKICLDPKMPSRSMVHRWLEEHEEFRDQYARAREVQADQFADQILEVAFDAQGDVLCDEYGNEKLNHEFVQRSKLKIDALKWHASKTAPKKYGDKMETTLQGNLNHQHFHKDVSEMTDEELAMFIKSD